MMSLSELIKVVSCITDVSDFIMVVPEILFKRLGRKSRSNRRKREEFYLRNNGYRKRERLRRRTAPKTRNTSKKVEKELLSRV